MYNEKRLMYHEVSKLETCLHLSHSDVYLLTWLHIICDCHIKFSLQIILFGSKGSGPVMKEMFFFFLITFFCTTAIRRKCTKFCGSQIIELVLFSIEKNQEKNVGMRNGKMLILMISHFFHKPTYEFQHVGF